MAQSYYHAKAIDCQGFFATFCYIYFCKQKSQ